MKKLVLYDLDGTLVDTRQDLVQAVNQMLTEMGISPLPADQIVRLVGRGLRQLVTDCLKTQDPQRIERGIQIFQPYYADHLLDHSRLYPGARELLEYFKDRKQAVLTNKPNPFSLEILMGLGVRSFFSEIIAGDSGGPKKPDPAALGSLLSRQGVRPAEALFVGDSAIDVQTGRNAGVETVIVLHGFSDENETRASKPDLTVRNLGELKGLAEIRNW